ncbi:FAD-binding oxidoreductase [Streptosporangium sp. NPDC006007]|uniref:NAD(P)/FAD-dependent oxidoreductase n=1 Tax=Streptosporangium sp. NPDC006007 TaxID=3154575 RepID=UPI0033BCF4DE
MPDRSDVVVVGGGVMGVSLALHLLEAGVENVRLLERDGLFEGTSGAGGGFLAPWTTISPLHGAESKALPIERYGMDFYAGLHAAGYDIDYRRNGVLWVAASEAAWNQVQQLTWYAADPGSFEVEPGRMAELTGGAVSGDGVYGGRYLPCGAQVTTAKVAVAMADRITERGGVIDTRRPVSEIRVRNGRVTGVETPGGAVDCETVVVAAGAWSNRLLEPLGAFLPAVPQVTSRIITEPLGIPETMPVLMLQGLMPGEPGGGTVLWVRGHHGGLLWGGMYTTYPRNILVDAPVPDRLDELPTDGVLENQRVARAATFIPALSRPASIRVKHGAPCYTPDDMALVGPVPGVEGLYAMGGDNELGVTHGPGFGKALADRVAHGTSDLADLTPWRIDRFGNRFTNQAETFQAVVESVGQLLVGEDFAAAGEPR